MKKFLILYFLFSILTISQYAFSNTSFDVKRIKEWNKTQNIKDAKIKSTDKKTVNNNKKTNDKKTNKSKGNKPLTNYQYDDINYKYNRLKQYTQDNINYSQTGQKIRFN